MQRFKTKLVVLLSSLVFKLVETREYTCSAGKFIDGQSGHVSCYTKEKDRGSISTIYLVKLLPNGTVIPVTICFKKNIGGVRCTVEKGYRHSPGNSICPQFTVVIPEVTASFEGKYWCQTDPPSRNQTAIAKNVCNLNVKDSEAAMFLIVLMATLPMASTDPVACKAGTFNPGETASVTCYFHEDVGKSLQHIYVSFRPFDARTEVEDTEVFVCFRKYIDTLVCNNSSGYNSDNVISSNLTLEIPDVQARFAGRYTCQLVPPGGQQSESCDLHVEGHPLSPGAGQSQCGVSPPPHDEEENEKEEQEEEDEEKVEQEEGIGIQLLAPIFFALIFLIYTIATRGVLLSAKESEKERAPNAPPPRNVVEYKRAPINAPLRTPSCFDLWSDKDDECANVTSMRKKLEMFEWEKKSFEEAESRHLRFPEKEESDIQTFSWLKRAQNDDSR